MKRRIGCAAARVLLSEQRDEKRRRMSTRRVQLEEHARAEACCVDKIGSESAPQLMDAPPELCQPLDVARGEALAKRESMNGDPVERINVREARIVVARDDEHLMTALVKGERQFRGELRTAANVRPEHFSPKEDAHRHPQLRAFGSRATS